MPRFFQLVLLLAAVIGTATGRSLVAAPIVELTVGKTVHRGLNIAHDDHFCWLAETDGSYERIPLADVKSFKKSGSNFRSLTSSAMAGELRRKYGRKLEIETAGRFVICAPPGQAKQYAAAIQEVEKSFKGYFNRRGWPLVTSEFPLTVIVFPDRKDFELACLEAGARPSPNLRGFYHPQTNRVVLYDQASEKLDAAGKAASRNVKLKSYQLDEASRKVAVHETIHQLSFNSGLHQRIGVNPRWIVEGLATVLEAGALGSKNRQDVAGRINEERLANFQEYRAKRRNGTIADLISDGEQLYQSAPLDFYSEAWALTFYLAEARRPDYVRYLKKIADRDPMRAEYSAEERLADFQSIFGKDIRWMETQFLRFMDQLQ